MILNVNEKVKVRLTNYGVEMLKEEHRKLNEMVVHQGRKPLPPLQIKTDDEGYTEFQLWTLMRTFGHVLTTGGKLPFETTIIIPDKPVEVDKR